MQWSPNNQVDFPPSGFLVSCVRLAYNAFLSFVFTMSAGRYIGNATIITDNR